MIFSFIYSDRVTKYLIYKSKIMNYIIDIKDDFNKPFVNAIVYNEYIIPGLNGIYVDELSSYYNMKKNNSLLSKYIFYNEQKPDISLEDHKDLIISQTLHLDKISLLVKDNKKILEYSAKNNIEITHLVSKDTFSKEDVFEQINIDNDIMYVDNMLSIYKLNKNICILGFTSYDKCLLFNKYIVKASDDKNIYGGKIMLLNDNMTLNEFIILLKKINYYDLEIASLSKLISEKR